MSRGTLPAASRVFVALDTPEPSRAARLARALRGAVGGIAGALALEDGTP